MGEFNGFILHVTFTMRGQTFRIISARRANAREGGAMKKKPDEATSRLSLAELRKQPSRTDWQRVAALTDAEITAAAESDPDALPLDEAFFDVARRMPTTRRQECAPPKTESPAQAGLLHDRHTRYRKPHRHTPRLPPNARSHPAF